MAMLLFAIQTHLNLAQTMFDWSQMSLGQSRCPRTVVEWVVECQVMVS